ncbi:hypothetical protein PLEOSDRAFT_1040044, partial [Pleurotus ostreatus PC15]
RLRRELAVWLKLKHPQVLPLYGIVSDFGPYPSMVCPWMDRGNLNNYLIIHLLTRDSELSQVCAGLAYLHSRSVVHGDLTGCNVLINGDGDACLSDFGLSTIISDLQGVSTFTSSIGGNVRFAAPELYEVGDDDIRTFPTARSDIYSLGSVILQIMTNEAPFYDPCDDMKKFRSLLKNYTVATFRPPIPSNQLGDIWKLAGDCWEVDHRKRPTMQMIISRLSTIATPPPTSSWTVRMGHQSIPFDRTTAQRDDGPRVE